MVTATATSVDRDDLVGTMHCTEVELTNFATAKSVPSPNLQASPGALKNPDPCTCTIVPPMSGPTDGTTLCTVGEFVTTNLALPMNSRSRSSTSTVTSRGPAGSAGTTHATASDDNDSACVSGTNCPSASTNLQYAGRSCWEKPVIVIRVPPRAGPLRGDTVKIGR